MNALGAISQIYMFILLALLFIGSGFALWSFIDFLTTKKKSKKELIAKSQVNTPIIVLDKGITKNNNLNGGYFMNNNGWIKLAVFSFVGIIVSVIVLGFVSTNANSNLSSHQQNQQQYQQQGMQMQSGANITTPMGNMQMQGNMQGNMNDQVMMQQQLMQMQQQLNQMQQQLGMMQNNGMSGNTSSMPQNGSNGGSMGGGMMMDSMMMNNMNSMPQQNNMNSMPQQNSGSMSMPMM